MEQVSAQWLCSLDSWPPSGALLPFERHPQRLILSQTPTFWISALKYSFQGAFSALSVTASIWLGIAAWQTPRRCSAFGLFMLSATSLLFLCIPFLSVAVRVRSDALSMLTLLGANGLILVRHPPALLPGQLRNTLSTSIPLQICTSVAWPMHFQSIAFDFVQQPLRCALVLFGATIAFIFVIISYVLPAFSTSDTWGRVLIRLVVLPILLESIQAVLRWLARSSLAHEVPSQLMVLFMLPSAAFSAILGRFFTTAVDSIYVTIGLSLAIAAVEMLMRFTMPARDAMYSAACARLPRRCRLCSHPGATAQERRWRQRRRTRAHYHFLHLDTMCEDVAVLMMIPTVAFFRIPATPGGAPLTLTDITGRVAVQLVLELGTDVAPFLAYAAARWWWGEAVGYTPIDTEATLAYHTRRLHLPGKALTAATPVALLDDSGDGAGKGDCSLGADVPSMSMPGTPSPRPPGDEEQGGGSGTPRSLDLADAASPTAATPHTPAMVLMAPAASPARQVSVHGGTPAPTVRGGGCDVAPQDTCVMCHPCCPRLDAAYAARVRQAHAPALQDEHAAVWEQLTAKAAWEAAGREGRMPWGYGVVHYLDLMTSRLLRAFEVRPPGWTASFLATMVGCAIYFFQSHFATSIQCPFVEEAGSSLWYYDYCPEQ